MKKIIYISLILLLPGLFALTSCHDYDDPKPEYLYTDNDFDVDKIVSIKEIKDMYTKKFGNAIGEGIEILDDYIIKGKVISNDKTGNIYRTLYIQDETAGIEIKIGTTSNYTEYIVGQWLYVKVRQLVLGNYRYNLSLGFASTDPDYANGYIDTKYAISKHIFKGEISQMAASDTIVVTSPDQLNDDMLGMLVRFEGLRSSWRKVGSNVYPSFLENKKEMNQATAYTNYSFLDVIADWKKYLGEVAVWEANGKPLGGKPQAPASPRPETLEHPTYAFKSIEENVSYYGSALFQFGARDDNNPTHNLVLRSSGYSHFALKPIPADGKVVDITAIYTKYSSKTGTYPAYQLVINDVTDVQAKN